MADNPQDKLPVSQVASILGTSSTPTLAMLSAAGTGASASIEGTNLSGKITVTSGISLVTAGSIMTLTLADGYQFPTKMFLDFTAGNASFAGILTSLHVSTTKNVATLTMTGLALTLNTTYIGNYIISGY